MYVEKNDLKHLSLFAKQRRHVRVEIDLSRGFFLVYTPRYRTGFLVGHQRKSKADFLFWYSFLRRYGDRYRVVGRGMGWKVSPKLLLSMCYFLEKDGEYLEEIVLKGGKLPSLRIDDMISDRSFPHDTFPQYPKGEGLQMLLGSLRDRRKLFVECPYLGSNWCWVTTTKNSSIYRIFVHAQESVSFFEVLHTYGIPKFGEQFVSFTISADILCVILRLLETNLMLLDEIIQKAKTRDEFLALAALV